VPEVVVYTVPWCPYCRMAVQLLRSKGVPFDEIDVEGDRAKRAWLREATGQSTVPQIFVGGKSLGGYTDVAALDRRGELDVLLGNP
jgi:glutaredoxin 3